MVSNQHPSHQLEQMQLHINCFLVQSKQPTMPTDQSTMLTLLLLPQALCLEILTRASIGNSHHIYSAITITILLGRIMWLVYTPSTNVRLYFVSNRPSDSTLIFLISQLPVSMLSWKKLGSLAHLSSMQMKQSYEGIETFAFRSTT